MIERFTWYKQAAYRYEGEGRIVYIDPWGIPDDAPEADAVFITHAHFDHFNEEDLDKVRTKRTRIVAPLDVATECGLLGDVVPIRPGDDVEGAGVTGQAVPAYNIVQGREDKHPKDKNWVGYVLDFGGTSVYHAGDTDHIPDLSSVKAQVAFVPIGGTFTMDVEEAAGLVREIKPEVAVPMHYGFVVGSPSDADRFRQLCDPIEVRTLDPVNPFEQP